MVYGHITLGAYDGMSVTNLVNIKWSGYEYNSPSFHNTSRFAWYLCRRKMCPPGNFAQGTYFPRKFCLTRQDILSILGQYVCL